MSVSSLDENTERKISKKGKNDHIKENGDLHILKEKLENLSIFIMPGPFVYSFSYNSESQETARICFYILGNFKNLLPKKSIFDQDIFLTNI